MTRSISAAFCFHLSGSGFVCVCLRQRQRPRQVFLEARIHREACEVEQLYDRGARIAARTPRSAGSSSARAAGRQGRRGSSRLRRATGTPRSPRAAGPAVARSRAAAAATRARPAGQLPVGDPALRAPGLHHAGEVRARLPVQEDELRVGKDLEQERHAQRVLGRLLEQPHLRAGSRRLPVAIVNPPGEPLAQLRDDRGRRVAARQPVGACDAAARPKRGDALDELVALAADREHARSLRERLEQQRAARARRAQDDDRPLQHRRPEGLRLRHRHDGGLGSRTNALASILGTSTVGSSTCGNSSVTVSLPKACAAGCGDVELGGLLPRPARASAERHVRSSRASSDASAQCCPYWRRALAAARAASGAVVHKTCSNWRLDPPAPSPCRYQQRTPVVAELDDRVDELAHRRGGLRPLVHGREVRQQVERQLLHFRGRHHAARR